MAKDAFDRWCADALLRSAPPPPSANCAGTANSSANLQACVTTGSARSSVRDTDVHRSANKRLCRDRTGKQDDRSQGEEHLPWLLIAVAESRA